MDALSTQNPSCPYCDAASTLLVRTRDFNRKTTDETFCYFQCTRCALVFLDPSPTDMASYYEGGYEPIPDTLADLREIASREKHRLNPILKYKTQGTLLEIGPWRGVFCCNAKDAGFDVSAIEMDQKCVAFLNETVGVDAMQSYDPAGTLRKLDRNFDVIALWHCLEHLPRPWEVVEQSAKRLNPGGLLLVSIPNIGSYEFSILRERWRHLDAPRHLFFYPKESLVSLCETNGLTKLDLNTCDSISHALARDTWHHWSLHKSSNTVLRRILFRLACEFAHSRERKLQDAGSGMTAVFQLRDPGNSSSQ